MVMICELRDEKMWRGAKNLTNDPAADFTPDWQPLGKRYEERGTDPRKKRRTKVYGMSEHLLIIAELEKARLASRARRLRHLGEPLPTKRQPYAAGEWLRRRTRRR